MEILLNFDTFPEARHVDLRYRILLVDTLLRKIDKFASVFFIDPKTKVFSSSRVTSPGPSLRAHLLDTQGARRLRGHRCGKVGRDPARAQPW